MLRRLLTLGTLVAAALAATPLQFTFNAPAIAAGSVQGSAFSLSFTLADFLPSSGTIDLTAEPTLVVTGSPRALYLFSSAKFFNNNSASIDFRQPGIPVLRATLSSGQPFDHVGTYTIGYQLIDFNASPSGSNTTTATLIITDLNGQSVPEPSSALLVGAGLAAWSLRRLRRATLGGLAISLATQLAPAQNAAGSDASACLSNAGGAVHALPAADLSLTKPRPIGREGKGAKATSKLPLATQRALNLSVEDRSVVTLTDVTLTGGTVAGGTPCTAIFTRTEFCHASHRSTLNPNGLSVRAQPA